MQFRAKIKKSSTVYRNWAAGKRRTGKVSGVRFRKVGSDYVSVEDPLHPDHVSALLRNNAVDLEITTAPVGGVEIVEDPDDSGDEASEGDGNPSADTAEPAKDSLASLFRDGVPKLSSGEGGQEGDQEPVMRRRGRPPGPR